MRPSRNFVASLAMFGAALLTGCEGVAAPTPFPTLPPIPMATPGAISRAAQEQIPTPRLRQSADPGITRTPDPFEGLTIEDLSSRTYGGGEIKFDAEQRVSQRFSRYKINYPSDGLNVHGFLNVPRGEGPFPVLLVLHGYVEPEEYGELGYTARYADALAAEGFLVFHPNYRNYPPSDPGPNPFRVGYAVDVLNLLALIQQQAGESGPLEHADASRMGLFGHSMGGGISLRAITVQAPVQAAVLYGSMNADELLNFQKIYEWSEGERGLAELNIPPNDLARISPISFLDGINAAVSIHHGEQDSVVPPEWSADLCRRLTALGKTVECFSYPNEPHTFIGFGGIQLIERAAAFYREHLGGS